MTSLKLLDRTLKYISSLSRLDLVGTTDSVAVPALLAVSHQTNYEADESTIWGDDQVNSLM